MVIKRLPDRQAETDQRGPRFPLHCLVSARGRQDHPHPRAPWPICMGRTTFPIMKYSQVTGSLRNDGGQSIAFQRVIFSPFRLPCLSCWQSLAQEEGWIEAQVWHLSDRSSVYLLYCFISLQSFLLFLSISSPLLAFLKSFFVNACVKLLFFPVCPRFYPIYYHVVLCSYFTLFCNVFFLHLKVSNNLLFEMLH